jgi:hypothetical protein
VCRGGRRLVLGASRPSRGRGRAGARVPWRRLQSRLPSRLHLLHRRACQRGAPHLRSPLVSCGRARLPASESGQLARSRDMGARLAGVSPPQVPAPRQSLPPSPALAPHCWLMPDIGLAPEAAASQPPLGRLPREVGGGPQVLVDMGSEVLAGSWLGQTNGSPCW